MTVDESGSAHKHDPEMKQEDAEEIEPEPTLYDYLQTPEGHELAKRAVDVLERLADAKIKREQSGLTSEKWLQGIIISAVIVAASLLAILDKFTPTIGLLFGALIGYVFGKRYR